MKPRLDLANIPVFWAKNNVKCVQKLYNCTFNLYAFSKYTPGGLGVASGLTGWIDIL